MRTAAEWLLIILLLGGWTGLIAALSWRGGFAEGQRVQDTAYGNRLEAVIEKIDELEYRCRIIGFRF